MKLPSLIPSLVLGAALAASAQTAAPGQPTEPKPAGNNTEFAAVVRLVPLDTAEHGPLHNLRLLPGTLPQVVEQLQGACTKAAAERGWSRETAEENLRKAKALVQQVDANAQSDGELGIAGKELSKAEAQAEAVRIRLAATASKGATEQAEADFGQADRTYQRLVSVAQKNPNLVAQQVLDDAKAKRDATNRTLDAARQETAQKETAEANLSRAQARLDQAVAKVTAERVAAGKALLKASEFVMPTVTYGPGTSEAKISAALDLADVRPLDALALIAAAAGCDLNPINSVLEEVEVAGQHIIGYSFELSPRRASSFAPNDLRPGARQWRSSSDSGGGVWDLSTGRLVHSSGSSSDSGSGSLAVYPDGLTRTGGVIDTYLGSPPPAPGTTSPPGAGKSVPEPLPQTAPPIVPPGSAGGGSPKPTAGAYSTWFIPIETDMNAQVVRIYALGPVLGGEDPNLEANKENDFKALILEAMNLADASGPPEPKLYFHEKSRVLIARATLRQQEIIEQAVAAMKENDRSVSTVGGIAFPQAKPPKP